MDKKNLVDKIIEASSQIHKASTRGRGDWVVTGSKAADAIQEVYRGHVARLRKEKIKRIYDC